jgi:transcriptional regulator with GAF, ATPase, and Fis domain
VGRPGERSRADRFEIPAEGINFEHFERDLILQAMDKADWVIAKAAKMLGMSYRTLQYRLEKFDIKKAEPKGARSDL